MGLNRLWFGSDWGPPRLSRGADEPCVSIAFGSALIGVLGSREGAMTTYGLNRLWFGSDWGPRQKGCHEDREDVSIAFGSALIGVRLDLEL